MDYNIDFDLIYSQKLILTPQLKQALEILEMSSNELFNYIDEQIEMNPVLEVCREMECVYNESFITTIEQMEWENELFSGEDYADTNGECGEGYLEGLDSIIASRSDSRFCMNEYFPFVISDVNVKCVKEGFEVLINEEAEPSLRISEYYKKIVTKDITEDTRRFLVNKLSSANWLIKCLEERKKMIKTVVEYLIKTQFAFFEKGKKNIKPVDTQSAATELRIHRYILQAVIHEKYLQCKWGSFPLNMFFK